MTPVRYHEFFVASSLLSLRRARRSHPGAFGDAAFLVGLVVVFVLQFFYGVRLAGSRGDHDALDVISVLVIVCFLVGILRKTFQDRDG